MANFTVVYISYISNSFIAKTISNSILLWIFFFPFLITLPPFLQNLEEYEGVAHIFQVLF